MLDTVIGPKSDPEAVDRLLEFLGGLSLDGTIYIGYPLVVVGDQPRAVDAMLTCRDHGAIVFDIRRDAMLLPVAQLAAEVQQLRQAVSLALARSRKLTSGGRLIVEVRVITLDPSATAPLPAPPAPPTVQQSSQQHGLPRFSLRRPYVPEAPAEAPAPTSPRADLGLVTGWYNLMETLGSLPPIDAATLKFVDQAVQRLGAGRPALGGTALGNLAGPRAGVLAEIDGRIANLDRWQKAAAIEMPEGPQRIRGLAGSGKTVVLAWKAAYLHAGQPNWRIVLMFYGRTLYEPLRDMVRRFYHEHTQREPDWTRLRLQHAWGAKDRAGVYTEIAAHVGVASLGIADAKKRYPYSRIFEGVCGEVLAAMARDPDPLYDVALMDEAQDLPATFMEMVYRVTAPPKRIVWAYDDLQNLGVYRPTSPAQLFGTNQAGLPNVPDLAHDEGDARADIILPVCYRNTPWALTTAHAVGLGVYRRPVGNERTGLLQFYDDPELWKEIGYVIEEGVVAPGERVTLVRGAHSTPTYFTDLIQPEDAVQCFTFQDSGEEAEWVADSVLSNLLNDGLTPHDVMIVSANPFLKAEDAMPLIKALTRRNIPVHYAAGDELFGTKPSVPIAIINRAKGNEAAMVYVVHTEHGAGLQDPVRRRNTLFTAITRSRAWVRITGSGPNMITIQEEVRHVAATGYRLVLTVPTVDELNRLPKLKRDVTAPR